MTKWTIETSFLEAKKYTKRYDFQLGSRGAYGFLRANNLIDGACKHMNTLRHVWSKEKLIQIAKKYEYRKSFEMNDNSAYQAATRLKILNEICSHMKNVRGLNRKKWHKNLIVDLAIQYSHLGRLGFRNKFSGAYDAALDNGWLKDIHAVIPQSGCCSKMELELLKCIKKRWPTAKSQYFKSDSRRFFQTRFQLDIYIPELKKGIEFDGNYWHGEGFDRSWTKDPDFYKNTKNLFFDSLGIDIVHITESEWVLNSTQCLLTCLDFLERKYE